MRFFRFIRKSAIIMATAMLPACSSIMSKQVDVKEVKTWPFEGASARYSPIDAFGLAEAAYLAYEDPGLDLVAGITTCAQAVAWGFTKCVQIHDTTPSHFHALLLVQPNLIILAFRGTSSLDDGWVDFDTGWLKFDGHYEDNYDHFSGAPGCCGRVHRGFLKFWAYIAPKVQTALNAERDLRQPLWITGHSLGGALAILAAASLNLSNHPVSGIYTFGQPRVGDKDFSTEFNRRFADRTFRIVHNNDLVPAVPFQWMDFCHVGQCLYLDPDGTISACTYQMSLRDFFRGIGNGIQKRKFLPSQVLAGGHVDGLYASDLLRNLQINPLAGAKWDGDTCGPWN